MIRTPTAETVRQTDYRADSRNGILQHYGCIVPSGILRSSQFRIFLKLPLGNIICIGKLVFQILQQDTVIKEQVETFTIAITTGSQYFRCIYRSLFHQCQTIIFLIIKFSFVETSITLILCTHIILNA